MQSKHTKRKYPNRVRLQRNLMGLSQADVAHALEITNVYIITRYERGEIMPSGNHLLKMRRLFNTDVAELYYDHYKTIEEEVDKAKETIKSEPFHPPFPIVRSIVNDYK